MTCFIVLSYSAVPAERSSSLYSSSFTAHMESVERPAEAWWSTANKRDDRSDHNQQVDNPQRHGVFPSKGKRRSGVASDLPSELADPTCLSVDVALCGKVVYICESGRCSFHLMNANNLLPGGRV